MDNNNSSPEQVSKLRQKAEDIFKKQSLQSAYNTASFSPEDLQKTIHELQIHQIELEMQNEELRRIQMEKDRIQQEKD
ncbi:MAG: hypothetical protein HQK63_12715, partial [Desulfamplus sp.]|nr:hypothetical protein [Desulfamplus sp.]